VGGRTASPARLAGDAVTVPGTVSLFATGSAAPVRLMIDNATTKARTVQTKPPNDGINEKMSNFYLCQ
jgi:hypothetical protein